MYTVHTAGLSSISAWPGGGAIVAASTPVPSPAAQGMPRGPASIPLAKGPCKLAAARARSASSKATCPYRQEIASSGLPVHRAVYPLGRSTMSCVLTWNGPKSTHLPSGCIRALPAPMKTETSCSKVHQKLPLAGAQRFQSRSPHFCCAIKGEAGQTRTGCGSEAMTARGRQGSQMGRRNREPQNL